MNYSQELAREFRNAQNTFVYFLISANIAIIGFLFTQIDKFSNSIEFYFLIVGFMSFVASISLSAIYLNHGARWYQVAVNKSKINLSYSGRSPIAPEVSESLKVHEQEIDRTGEKMGKSFNRSIVFLIIGIVFVFGWKIVMII